MQPLTLMAGEKRQLAIQCDVLDINKRLGNVFFWVDGNRFGNDLFSFELENYFHRISEALERIPKLDRITILSARDYELLVNCLYDEFEPQACECFRDLANVGAMIDGTIWRDYYACDHFLLGVADGNGRQVVHAINHSANIYASVLLESRSFQRHMTELAANYHAFANAT